MNMVKDFVSGKELIQICSDRNIDISRAMLERVLYFRDIRRGSLE